MTKLVRSKRRITPGIVDLGELFDEAKAKAWELLAEWGHPIKITLEPGEEPRPILSYIAELEQNFKTDRTKGH